MRFFLILKNFAKSLEKLRKAVEAGYDKAIYYFKLAKSFPKQNELIAILNIEYGLVFNYYKNIIVAKEKFMTAMEFSGIILVDSMNLLLRI
jgi:hypothetical protein